MGFNGTLLGIQSTDSVSTDALLVATADKHPLHLGCCCHGTHHGWVWYSVDIPEALALSWAKDVSSATSAVVVLCVILDSVGYEGAFSFQSGEAVTAFALEIHAHLPARLGLDDPVGQVFQTHASPDVTRAWITDVMMIDSEPRIVFPQKPNKPRRGWWPFG
jgi:hypothetical protein